MKKKDIITIFCTLAYVVLMFVGLQVYVMKYHEENELSIDDQSCSLKQPDDMKNSVIVLDFE